MKKNFTITLIAIFTLVLNIQTLATIHTVSVGPNGTFSFSPPSFLAVTGDTVRWVWASGSHTTTCDGSSFTVLPAGAPSWNSPIHSGAQTFDYVLTVAGTYVYKCIPHGGGGMVGTLTVSLNTGLVTPLPPVNHLDILTAAYSSKANIKFYIPSDGKVTLSIYDLTGKRVETIVDGMLAKGEYNDEWDAISAPNGTYLCRLESKDLVLTKKFILRK